MRGRWLEFLADRRGNVAIMTAFTAPIMVAFLGGAVDYAISLDARVKLQSAVDAALLATAEHKSSNPNLSLADLKTYFRKQLEGRLERRMKKVAELDEIEITQSSDHALTAKATAHTRTRFLQLVAVDRISIRVEAEVKSARARTEVALVLDVTGSMAGSKLRELKEAAKSFLDTIEKKIPVNDPEAFKVAVVPFSQYVNVGMQYRNADWIDVPEDGWRQTSSSFGWWWWWWWGGSSKYVEWEGCVGSRSHPLNVLDESYTTPVPGVMNYAHYSPSGEWVTQNYCPNTPILPLTSLKTDKQKIVQAIDNLTANGSTYIPAGLMWGWRVLSSAKPFTEGADEQDIKRWNVRKVIVLMTDGENTTSPYLDYQDSYSEHTGGDPDYANDITLEACDNIKEVNVATGRRNADIVTITFNVYSTTVKNLLKECATLGSYDVKSGQLVSIFDQVAEQLTELHLSR